MPGAARLRFVGRDHEILETLTHRVRVLSLSQITRTWWASGRNGASLARRALTRLARADLLHLEPLSARPEVNQSEPLALWQPDLPAPDLGRVAYQCQQRWRLPAVTAMCALATAAAGHALGGRGGRFPRQTELTHDLHLAHVYLLMRAALPTRASSWRFEDTRPRGARDAFVPDALVTDGGHTTVIECAGAYDEPKLRAFHAACVEADLAYELW